MISRVLAIILGVIAGVAVLAACCFAWGEIVALAPTGSADVAAALWVPVNHLAWAMTCAVGLFAVVALATAVAGGIVETNLVRRRVAEARIDSAGLDRANAPDWRAIFAETAIAGLAAAIPESTPYDPSTLLALETVWRDRLTLSRTIAPLPAIVLACDAALAIFGVIAGTGWELALAAGASGWFVVSLARYLAVLGLSPLIAWTMGETVPPMRATGAPRAIFQPAINQGAPKQPILSPAATPLDAGAIARDIAEMLADPIERLADAASRLGSPTPAASREQAVDSALAEIRAGIERLLAGG
jgi:hypothetical protein